MLRNCTTLIFILFLTAANHLMAQVVANADTIGICTGYPNAINVLSNDEGIELVLEDILVPPSTGTVSFDPDGTISLDYAVAADFDPAEALIYLVADSAGNIDIGVLQIFVSDGLDCVWPGDANDDNIANHLDLLAIGLAYGDTGPLRPDISEEWNAQYAFEWDYSSLLATLNRKFIDCNGDGIIDAADITPILNNYGLEHARTSATEGGTGFPPLGVGFYSDTIYAGSTVTIPIYLGTEDLPAGNVYGLAFTLGYNSDIIVPGSLTVDFSSGWLGASTISLARTDATASLTDVAVSRTNKTSVTGYGNIGTVSFVMEDNLAGRLTDISSVLEICPIEPTIINALGNATLAEGIDLQCDSVVVLQVSTDISLATSQQWNIQPNPVTHELSVITDPNTTLGLRVQTLTGQHIATYAVSSTVTGIDVSPLSPGTYFLVLQLRDGSQSYKQFIKL
ncbi:MAG: hypothetical protein ABR95_08615 [Sphingobacteriales bacterium BACL12 MAG-120813-bin55]|jgi:hypothetical protein|nr:MAG: hypothetical protein ABR94_10520 [Sphingobacteriales bacterium BACL12 MAG-120802-bin5]KRP13981.1 MAG: hypothetical protein ABR95_08615 [Sphingobacteriales bacterium BACL12 MAG-120813-bin55]